MVLAKVHCALNPAYRDHINIPWAPASFSVSIWKMRNECRRAVLTEFYIGGTRDVVVDDEHKVRPDSVFLNESKMSY